MVEHKYIKIYQDDHLLVLETNIQGVLQMCFASSENYEYILRCLRGLKNKSIETRVPVGNIEICREYQSTWNLI
jgi:hypothetical protein